MEHYVIYKEEKVGNILPFDFFEKKGSKRLSTAYKYISGFTTFEKK